MAWVPTNDLVQSQIAMFQNYANNAFSTALSALQEIADAFQGGYAEIGSGGGVSGISQGDLPKYNKPQPVPVAPNIDFAAPADPGLPIDDAAVGDVLAAAKQQWSRLDVPVFDAQPLPITLPLSPSRSLPAPPEDPAPLEKPEYPTAPAYEAPPLPELRPIELPDLTPPDLSAIAALIAELRAAKPTAPIAADPPGFGALASHYYSMNDAQLTAFVGRCQALASVSPRLTDLLAGDSIGIPTAVARGMRDRAFAAEDRLAIQAEREAMTDWQARGFTLPGGALEARLATIRGLNRDKKAQLNRDLWLEEAKLEIENLRFAIQQGIAYEGLLRESWSKLSDLVRAMASTEIDIDLKVLESAIGLYKAQVEAWSVEFSTIKEQLQIELAKLDVYKAELDGQKLIGQLNQQDVDLYQSRWEAIGTQIAAYKAQIEAANGLLQAELAKLDWAAKRAQIYSVQVAAYGEEWKAYGIAADAEKSKVELYKAQADAFKSRVDGYAVQIGAAKTMADLDVTGLRLRLETWQSQLEKYKAELQTEIARVDSLVKSGSIDADIYKTKALVETSYTDFEMKKLSYQLDIDRLNTDTDIKQAELEQNKQLALQKMALDALDAIARVGAQLSGSAMSAMNVHASLSSGSTTSDSYQETHYYDEST